MSVKARCFSYCNECNNNKNSSPWKIVESDKHPSHEKPHEEADGDDHKTRQIKKWYTTSESKSCYEKPHKDEHRDKDECRDKKKKHNCCKFLCTLVSVKNPDTELSIPEEVPIAATQGPNICTDLTGWTDIVPDALNAFDNATGTFTAPEDGDYQVSLVVNFKTSVSIPIPIPGIEVPYVEIYDPDNNPEHVLSSNFPVAFVIVQNPSTGEPALNIISILFIGQVIVNAVIPLRAGQRIRIRACTNGLQYIPLITELGALQTSPAFIDFSPPNGDTTFTIYKIRNSPTVTIHCNN